MNYVTSTSTKKITKAKKLRKPNIRSFSLSLRSVSPFIWTSNERKKETKYLQKNNKKKDPFVIVFFCFEKKRKTKRSSTLRSQWYDQRWFERRTLLSSSTRLRHSGRGVVNTNSIRRDSQWIDHKLVSDTVRQILKLSAFHQLWDDFSLRINVYVRSDLSADTQLQKTSLSTCMISTTWFAFDSGDNADGSRAQRWFRAGLSDGPLIRYLIVSIPRQST